jgi:hypothetical protein
MSFKSKRKSKKVYSRRNKKTSKRRNKYSRKKRVTMRVTRKQKVMRGGDRNQRQLLGLARNLQNFMFEFNKKKFFKEKRKKISLKDIREEYINIIGPDFDPVRDYPIDLLAWVVGWHHDDPDNDFPPWYKFIGKLCEVPEGFFENNEERPQGNLQNVKQNLDNFDLTFPRDPTNNNIVEISVNILGPADQEKAVNNNGIEIPPDKYKFALITKTMHIRYVADTGTRNPRYHFPSVILYFYNQGIISFEELKSYLGNELPHSLLFNPRRESIMGAGDFTVDANGYIVELTGYSGHTKPLPSNVAYSANEFKKLGYHLEFVRTKTIKLQTGNTNRNDNNDRLIGTYYNMIYCRPKTVDEDEEDESAAMQPTAAAAAAAMQPTATYQPTNYDGPWRTP